MAKEVLQIHGVNRHGKAVVRKQIKRAQVAHYFANLPACLRIRSISSGCSMGGPNALLRLGWKRDSLKADDVITVEGSLARDGSPLANATSIVMTATGKRMLAGSSRDTSAAAER